MINWSQSKIWGSKISPFGNISGPPTPFSTSRPASSYNGSIHHGSDDKLPIVDYKEEPIEDVEKVVFAPESLERPVYVTSAVFVGLGILLVIVLAFGLATAKLVVETMVDKQVIRFALAAALPFLMLVGLYLSV